MFQFLPCRTPELWVQQALENLDILLIDHAQCEKKAASTAMNLMYRYVDRPDLLKKMSQLAREELLHFEQVVGILEERGIRYEHISAARYASGLRDHMRKGKDELIDLLIIGAFIEARSCERFMALIPHLDDALAKYYRSLVKSEGRHYQDYLSLAKMYADEPIDDRIAFFAQVEKELIESDDDTFRFHSGPVNSGPEKNAA
ncbi:tRNA-(ms[2]io[6]A)-hydroxylase [Oceanospirillum sediminis]|uniref:tRNA-(Ms[2]io[6]A)-hydroxylase n=1 Tax=Oceanospirillum sediminis TaxID=2760088 RepID=A0A839IVV1_9GAMM|nr:tRNA-(ms[2]io[6]A)-hydroxylase [Oceanospirillum sediminis]MBB1489101.1 tRNA-(ms[2]io[6]A)-hydroxylase [Oceanospirillum sediminis]